MADSKLYATGTIKVANVNGELVPFSPAIDSEKVSDAAANKSLESILLETDSAIQHAAKFNDAVQVFDSEPSNSVYESSPNDRMFIVMESDTWELTVKSTYGTTSYNYPSSGYYSAIPFDLAYQTGAQLNVDWGDGTKSTLTASNYSSSDDPRSSLHKYVQDSGPTIHKITISSPDFGQTALFSMTGEINSNSKKLAAPLRAFRDSLVSVDSPIPAVKGTYVCSPTYTSMYSSYLETNVLRFLFYDCINLESICAGLFDNHPNATNFSYIFGLSTTQGTIAKLETLPLKLLYRNASAQNFTYAFAGRAMKTLPEDLFKYATSQLSLAYAFDSLSTAYPMESIPSNLFLYDKNISSLSNLNLHCNEFEIRIGSKNVASATDFMKVTSSMNPEKRIVYVPKDSTTHASLNSVAEVQKLTVVGV